MLPTGGLKQTNDSVLVSIDAIRIANAKMIELKYQKEINSNLFNIIKNDSIEINNLTYKLKESEYNNNLLNKQKRNVINISICSNVILLALLLLSL